MKELTPFEKFHRDPLTAPQARTASETRPRHIKTCRECCGIGVKLRTDDGGNPVMPIQEEKCWKCDGFGHEPINRIK
jgi:DnaJ-class molecular chaperone